MIIPIWQLRKQVQDDQKLSKVKGIEAEIEIHVVLFQNDIIPTK